MQRDPSREEMKETARALDRAVLDVEAAQMLERYGGDLQHNEVPYNTEARLDLLVPLCRLVLQQHDHVRSRAPCPQMSRDCVCCRNPLRNCHVNLIRLANRCEQ